LEWRTLESEGGEDEEGGDNESDDKMVKQSSGGLLVVDDATMDRVAKGCGNGSSQRTAGGADIILIPFWLRAAPRSSKMSWRGSTKRMKSGPVTACLACLVA